MKRRVIVISERGALVGTQVLDDETASRVRAGLMAGPKQKLHEIELEVPAGHYRRENIAAWHKMVKKRLKLR
jgi:hypothetical protein